MPRSGALYGEISWTGSPVQERPGREGPSAGPRPDGARPCKQAHHTHHARAAHAAIVQGISAIDSASGLTEGRWYNRRRSVAQAQLAQAYLLKAIAQILLSDRINQEGNPS
jgi:hypothetical protein